MLFIMTFDILLITSFIIFFMMLVIIVLLIILSFLGYLPYHCLFICSFCFCSLHIFFTVSFTLSFSFSSLFCVWYSFSLCPAFCFGLFYLTPTYLVKASSLHNSFFNHHSIFYHSFFIFRSSFFSYSEIERIETKMDFSKCFFHFCFSAYNSLHVLLHIR